MGTTSVLLPVWQAVMPISVPVPHTPHPLPSRARPRVVPDARAIGGPVWDTWMLGKQTLMHCSVLQGPGAGSRGALGAD